MKNIRKVYFPLMWADETATIDDASADLFKSKATIARTSQDFFIQKYKYFYSEQKYDVKVTLFLC